MFGWVLDFGFWRLFFFLALLRQTWDVTFTLASMNLFLHDGDDETLFRVLNLGYGIAKLNCHQQFGC